jgi:mercuric reductase
MGAITADGRKSVRSSLTQETPIREDSQARAAGHAVKTSVLALDKLPRALAARDTQGLIKLVADAGADRVLGGVIMAPEGADSVQTLALALKAEMTTKALAETIFPYLTTVEGLKRAAQTFDKDVAKLSCCAG